MDSHSARLSVVHFCYIPPRARVPLSHSSASARLPPSLSLYMEQEAECGSAICTRSAKCTCAGTLIKSAERTYLFLWYVRYKDYTEKKLIKRRVTCNSVTGVIRVARSRAASPSALQLLKSTELSLQVHSTTVPNSLS